MRTVALTILLMIVGVFTNQPAQASEIWLQNELLELVLRTELRQLNVKFEKPQTLVQAELIDITFTCKDERELLINVYNVLQKVKKLSENGHTFIMVFVQQPSLTYYEHLEVMKFEMAFWVYELGQGC